MNRLTQPAPVPQRPTLPKLREAVHDCRACGLWRDATQAVFGEGPRKARVMLVGEQPGDQEDRVGAPFVGPAGRVLDEGLAEAGIERRDAYVTNTVKHFKWKPGRGKRRLHQKPNAEESRACRPWLDAELRVVRPEIVVCLGATAAQALLGRSFRVTKQRGESFGFWCRRRLPRPGFHLKCLTVLVTILDVDFAPLATATIHPSAILRMDDAEERRAEMSAFVADLRRVAKRLGDA